MYTTRSSGGEAPCVCQTQEVSIEVKNSMLVTLADWRCSCFSVDFLSLPTLGGPGGMVGPRRRGGDGGGPHPLYQVRRGPGAC